MDRVILVFVGCWIPLTTNAVTLNRTYPQPKTIKNEPILPIFVPGIFGEIYNSALGRSRDPVIVTKGKDIPKLGSAPSNEANEFKFETSTQRSPGFDAFSETNFSSKINDNNLTQGPEIIETTQVTPGYDFEKATFRIIPLKGDKEQDNLQFGDETLFFENIPRSERDDKKPYSVYKFESPLYLNQAPSPLFPEGRENILIIPETDPDYDSRYIFKPTVENVDFLIKSQNESPLVNHFGSEANRKTDTDVGPIEESQHYVGPVELSPHFSLPVSTVATNINNPISYSYNYNVNHANPEGPHFSKHEDSDGVLTKGEYSVKLPDGRIQTVSYSVKGEGGFTVNVKYL